MMLSPLTSIRMLIVAASALTAACWVEPDGAPPTARPDTSSSATPSPSTSAPPAATPILVTVDTGRTLNAAIDIGFRRAWTSIRDSNVSTLITCFILFWFGNQFGASVVKGFALTLAVGVGISMFSAITVTRTFLKMVLGTPLARSHFLFNAEEVKRTATTSRRAAPATAEE